MGLDGLHDLKLSAIYTLLTGEDVYPQLASSIILDDIDFALNGEHGEPINKLIAGESPSESEEVILYEIEEPKHWPAYDTMEMFDLLLTTSAGNSTSFDWEESSSEVDDLDTNDIRDSAFDYNNKGVVLSFKDSVVTIKGLLDVKANELIYFNGGASGLALNLEYSIVKALVFGNSSCVRASEIVTRSYVVMRIGVGSNVLGRVVDPLGRPLDGLGEIDYTDYWPIERKAPGVITRKKINEPLRTGTKVVDALVPIGRGQRELILGDRKTGKTAIAIDSILNQGESIETFKGLVVCIYVAIGKRLAEVIKFSDLFAEKKTTHFSIVVAARASDPASLQFLAPYSACTLGEYFTYRGRHAMIIYDDLTKHADAYRQISLLLRRPVGREAYPGDIFYLHSRLLERAVKLNASRGNGTLTALPVVETIQGDVSAYIPTNVISITDGQIYLDLARFQKGLRPAVDPGISVSRVGSSAQSVMMKRLSSSIKLELAQFKEVEQFSKFGSEVDPATARLLVRSNATIVALKQPRYVPLVPGQQIITFHTLTTPAFYNAIFGGAYFDISVYLNSLVCFVAVTSLFLPYFRTIDGLPELPYALLAVLMKIHCYYFYVNDVIFEDYIDGEPVPVTFVGVTTGKGRALDLLLIGLVGSIIVREHHSELL